MKDRMIIIREKVLFIVTVSHEQTNEPDQEAEAITPQEDASQQQISLPEIKISAN